MTAETVSRWSRAFVAAGVCWLVIGLGAVSAHVPRRGVVAAALLGFVLHTVFGKAYSLVPTYFDRDLSPVSAPRVQFPLTVAGTALLVVDGARLIDSGWIGQVGATAWMLGVVLFLGAIGWTIRDNLTGAETATGEANAERRPVDRLSNAFVPVALAYLAVGSYALLASVSGLPTVLDGYPARASHLLAAGTGGLLVFAIGFRLLPRFLVAAPPRTLVPIVLVAGAFAPACLAVGLPAGPLFHVGAALQALAVLGFAVSYLVLFIRSPRTRVGFYGVLAGALFGVLGVALGFWMAVGSPPIQTVTAHFRVNLFGFLGLTIIGVSYQFYPPAVGTFPGASDRVAGLVIGTVSIGLLAQVGGFLGSINPAVTIGESVTLLGGLTHAVVLLELFVERYGAR